MSVDLADRLIDAHIHVWSDDLDSYPFMPGMNQEDPWLPLFTPEDHTACGRGFGKMRANLVQITWYGLDHSYIADLIAREPDRFVGTGMVPAVCDVGLASPGKAMVALSEKGISAFRVRGGSCRQAFGDVSRWLDYDSFEEMFRIAADENLALSFLMKNEELPEITRMCQRFPDTSVILDHMAGCRVRDGRFPEDEVGKLCDVARFKNVTVKLGPIHVLSEAGAPFLDALPLIERVVNAFGPERCMWESDSGGPFLMEDPQRDFAACVALINDHAEFLTDSDREKIFFGTAERVLFNR